MGARIAARSYSLFATLAHWTRQHRALALSAVAALAVLIAGTLVYVRNIAAERDRADLSNEAARRAQAIAETSLDELTLKHAELLQLTRAQLELLDPSCLTCPPPTSRQNGTRS